MDDVLVILFDECLTRLGENSYFYKYFKFEWKLILRRFYNDIIINYSSNSMEILLG